jgi:hypothetical protein
MATQTIRGAGVDDADDGPRFALLNHEVYSFLIELMGRVSLVNAAVYR